MPEIMEAPAVEAVESTESVESTETPIESTKSTETVDQSGTQPEKEALTQKTAPTKKLSLDEVVKTKADALKAIDPSLPAAMRTAAFELGALYKEFPGGLKEAVANKVTLAAHGGVEGLKESAETLSGMQSLAKSFFDQKPEFIANLIEESAPAFSHMMATGMESWKKSDPEMYNHVQARVLTQTLDGLKASDTLAAIWNAMEDKNHPTVQAIAKLWEAIDGFRKTGDQAPERKIDPKQAEYDKREQALAQREAQAMLAPIKADGLRHLQTVTDREMAANYQWDKTDADVQEAVRERIQKQLKELGSKDRMFTAEFDRLKERGDTQKLSKHLIDFQDRVLPSVIQRVAKLFAVKPKNAPAVVRKPVAQAGAATQSKEFERVTARPTAGEIDRSRTTEDMILDDKYVLKSGRRVMV